MVVTGLFRHACKTVCVVLVGALLGTGIAYGDEAKQAETEPFAVFHNAYYAYMKFGDYPAALRLSSEWIADWEFDDDYLPTMGSGETIILSETYTAYTPAFNIGLNARTLGNQVVTRPRFTSQIVNTDF
jgi:hypothetical protein